MKILLLEHPRRISRERCNDIANTPLSSCLLSGSIAGMLAAEGHRLEIVEGYLERLSYAQVEQRIHEFAPDLLGVHMVYHWQGNGELFSLLQRLKGDGCAPYITVYGYYPTFAYQEILQQCPEIDSAILGEPEATAAELARVLSRQEGACDIAGLALRDAAGTIRWSRRQLIADLDALPFPERTEAMFQIPEVNIQGSRGCYGSCTFCYINPFYGQGRSHWRARSPENIVAEIDEIIGRWGQRNFYFTDPNFFGPGERGQQRALRLAALLESRQIRFGIEGRVNDIHDRTIAALVDAGLWNILIGMESGRDDALRRMHKMTTVDQNERALETLRRHGIEPNIGFIMFEPDSSLEDIRINFEFLQRNRLLTNLAITANLLYHHQIILMGTPAFKRLEQDGRLQQVNTSYEGMTAYSNPSVATLAGVDAADHQHRLRPDGSGLEWQRGIPGRWAAALRRGKPAVGGLVRSAVAGAAGW